MHCAVKKFFSMKEWNYKEIFNTNFNLSFCKGKSENRSFCDIMKSIVLSNYVIQDAQKKKLINEWEINKRKVEKTKLWIRLVNHSQFKTIDHKFLVSDHPFLPNDRDFSSIEIAKRKAKSLFSADECFESMSCRKTNLSL